MHTAPPRGSQAGGTHSPATAPGDGAAPAPVAQGTGWPSGVFSSHYRLPPPTWSPWLWRSAPEPSLGLMASRSSRRDPAAEVTREPVSGAPVGPVGRSLWTLSSSCMQPFHRLSESHECRQEPSLVSMPPGACGEERTGQPSAGRGPRSGPSRKLAVKGSFSCNFLLRNNCRDTVGR